MQFAGPTPPQWGFSSLTRNVEEAITARNEPEEVIIVFGEKRKEIRLAVADSIIQHSAQQDLGYTCRNLKRR